MGKPDMDVPLVPPNIGYNPDYGDQVVWIRGAVGLRGKVTGARAAYVEVLTDTRGPFHEIPSNLAPEGSALGDAAEATLTTWLMTPAGQAHQKRFP